MILYTHKYFFALSLVLLILSCATDYKRWPEGGPDDNIHPYVVSSSVKDNSLNVDKDITVEIEFSEFIDRNSASNAVNISPRSVSKASIVKWYDKSLEIDLKDLDSDRTVVMTLNTTLKDTRGNTLLEPFSVSFSTGSEIDKKYIHGTIDGAVNKFDLPKLDFSKIKVNLYPNDTDSIDYSKTEPEYSTGLSSDMNFELKNLNSGSYRLTAFYDINNDSKIQFNSEMVGFYPEVIDLSSADSLNFNLGLGINDTESPYILSTSIISCDIMKIEFSEEVRQDTIMIDSLTADGGVMKFSEYLSKEQKQAVFVKISDNFVQGQRIRIKLNDISDIFGNIIRDNYKLKIHTVTDTVPEPRYRIEGRIGQFFPADGVMFIQTNRLTNDSLCFEVLGLDDDSLRTKLEKGLSFEPFRVNIDLQKNNLTQKDYELRIIKADSVIYRSKLKINDEEGSGSISGIVQGGTNSNILFCKNVKNKIIDHKIGTGSYKIELNPGKYVLALLEDTNGDGVMNTDIVKNIIEKVIFRKDTVYVRKNWETTDIDFIVK